MKRLLLFLIALSVYCDLFAQELSLDAAIDKALKQNYSVKRQTYLYEAESARTLSVVSPEKPEIGFYSETTPYDQPGLTQRFDRWQISQQFEFPLTTYFRTRSQSYTADAAREKAEEAKSQIASDVRIRYADLLFRKALVDIYQENLKASKEFAEKTKRLLDVGESSLLESLRAQTELSRAQNLLSQAEADLVTSRQAFLMLLGEPSSVQLTLSDSLHAVFPEFSYNELYEQAKSQRPLAKAAIMEQDAASLQQTAAWSNFLPSIRLSYFQQKFKPSFEPDRNFYGGEISLSVPIWFWLGGRGEILEKSALHAAAQTTANEVIRMLEVEVQSAHVQYSSASVQVNRALQEFLPQAKKAYEVALRQYETGNAGYLELLDAKRAYYEAEQHAFEKRFQAESALAQLYRAVGKIR